MRSRISAGVLAALFVCGAVASSGCEAEGDPIHLTYEGQTFEVTVVTVSNSFADTEAVAAWELQSRPPGSAATISPISDTSASLRPDKAGIYTAIRKLVVGAGDIVTHRITVEAASTPPVANAGSDQLVSPGEVARLDGTASFDPDGDPLQFHWRMVERPQGSSAVLDRPDIADPSFVPDVGGVFQFELAVFDGRFWSDNLAAVAVEVL